MYIIANLRSKSLKPEINKRVKFYNQDLNKEEISHYQLNLFNENWQNVIKNVPYYRSLFQKGELPGKFNDWGQFQHLMPISMRNDYIFEKLSRTDLSRKSDYIRITGGSSGNPLQLPAWKTENNFTRPDQWVGRSWFDISPNDRCLWLMGGSYFIGGGLKGFNKKYKRLIKDFLLGYYRIPSYDLTLENANKIANIIIKQNPDYIIGFSAILDNIARANIDRKNDFQKLKIKAVIATSEIFPFEDSSGVIEDTFQTRVAMEYGSNETIAIAHTDPSGIFKVFWGNYFIEGIDNDNNRLKNILITSLYPRNFPLIRYNIGDQIELLDHDLPSWFGITEFKNVTGRKSNTIVCKDGSLIHTAAFSHAVRIFKEIIGYQIIIANDQINLNLVTNSNELSNNTIIQIRQRLSLIHSDLGEVQINRVNQLEQTKNGKTPLLIYR